MMSSNRADHEAIEIDAHFRALGKELRRRVLIELLDAPEDEVVRVPEDVRTGEQDLESLYVKLYHVHLPFLEDHGFIVWNDDQQYVDTGPAFDEIRPLLTRSTEH